jgi:hypothetical protein
VPPELPLPELVAPEVEPPELALPEVEEVPELEELPELDELPELALPPELVLGLPVLPESLLLEQAEAAAMEATPIVVIVAIEN